MTDARAAPAARLIKLVAIEEAGLFVNFLCHLEDELVPFVLIAPPVAKMSVTIQVDSDAVEAEIRKQWSEFFQQFYPGVDTRPPDVKPLPDSPAPLG